MDPVSGGYRFTPYRQYFSHVTGDSLNRIRMKHIAFKGSTCTFTDFIQIYMNGEPNATWNALENELAQRVIDGQHAFKLLWRVEWKSSEFSWKITFSREASSRSSNICSALMAIEQWGTILMCGLQANWQNYKVEFLALTVIWRFVRSSWKSIILQFL